VAALEAAAADATALQDMPPHGLERHGESLRLGLACLGAAAAAGGRARAAGPAAVAAAAAAAAARLEAALAAVGAERPPEQACAASRRISEFGGPQNARAGSAALYGMAAGGACLLGCVLPLFY